ncbi:nicotinamide riboside kinase 1 isoform X3 [Harpia harpyja]|uniref:nicotinamide riboside kinase 1 isoform X3 n=1 Tax=Harpia harpyja TaxID=202280 RepID=UPI0022B0D3AA|nr:nicotinamide riboside kinase 1 isoform X3 [Harpia harpyja]
MKVLVIGLGGVTNGGKTTLAEKLKKMLPNCDIISQDDFFKPESEVETDERGFKLYDVLDALYMDEMVKSIRNWMKSPTSSGVVMQEPQNTCDNLKDTEDVYILIVEGFLLYNYKPLNELWNRRYFLTLPYEECKRRRRLLSHCLTCLQVWRKTVCLEQYMCMKSKSVGWVKKSSIQLALVDSTFLVLTRLTFKGLQCPGWK